MNYLTHDMILDLHTFAVEHYGGRLGIRSQDRLQDVMSAPQQTMFGSELYPDLSSKIAVLGFMMLKNRPFNSANEITTLLSSPPRSGTSLVNRYVQISPNLPFHCRLRSTPSRSPAAMKSIHSYKVR